ncbi:hypothetical protein GQ43DRAFT_442567 [Delitschia confertaspora ATCC 74209]|uniref:Ubiquitin-like domain-containing protein n=1 Tax=Delitschia confertaspora ATCC 74209 TaxID=1513339 RepID=A0A9P4MWV0_9PLEO|nr:hypothetical protein GQ43DRAFT_442567 [Delitschia confertaspora ATCC 74209]
MATPGALPEQLLYLIIRFAASIPDLPLTVTSPRTTTTLSLKRLIRSRLPSPYAIARLRLIYAGKALADTAPLSLSLRLPPPPPPRHATHNDYGSGSKSKGKQPMRDESEPGESSEGAAVVQDEGQKYYIHCSMSDALSVSELASEATLASTSEATLKARYETPQTLQTSSSNGLSISGGKGDSSGERRGSLSSQAPAPQGFHRLLSSGFTPQEVAALRSQFQSNISYTHTPDTMPSPTTLRAMEDRWLDSTANDTSSFTGDTLRGDTGADPGWGAGFTVEEGGLDDLLMGCATGFFWPLGALVWGFWEMGVWSRRRQVAVALGVVINALFGFLRWSS